MRGMNQFGCWILPMSGGGGGGLTRRFIVAGVFEGDNGWGPGYTFFGSIGGVKRGPAAD
jgi:hypothetical protein